MRYLPLSATAVALLLAGTASPMAQSIKDGTILAQYVRLCVLVSDGSVRAYIPGKVLDGETGPLATPCNPATEVEIVMNAPGRGPTGSRGPAGPAGPQGEQGPPGSPG